MRLLIAWLPLLIVSTVVELTEANFNNFITLNSVALVEYYAPWCSYCKEMAPDYEQASKLLENITKLGRVNCDTESEICDRYYVDRYPTLKVFHDSKPFIYSGERGMSIFKHSLFIYCRSYDTPSVSCDYHADTRKT